MSEGTIHPLKHPVTVTLKSSAGEREETISFLTLRRMKAKDMRLADKIGGDVSTSIEMIAKLSGQPVAVIDDVDGAAHQAPLEDNNREAASMARTQTAPAKGVGGKRGHAAREGEAKSQGQQGSGSAGPRCRPPSKHRAAVRQRGGKPRQRRRGEPLNTSRDASAPRA